ncbi:hypothetical protein D9M69_664290 [compost metagenome]
MAFAKRCKNGCVRLLLTAKRVFPENCNRFIVDGAVRQTQGYPARLAHDVKIWKAVFQSLANSSRYEPMDVDAPQAFAWFYDATRIGQPETERELEHPVALGRIYSA